jgi:glutathionylspermidine synthase
MRSLIEDPAHLSERTYRRFMQRAELGGMLADHLVDGEPYLALNAVVLSAADSALLQSLTNIFSLVFDRVGRRLASDVPSLIEMGFPWVAAELLARESPRIPLVGRFDFVRDLAGHWWLLEFNADTPSGIREAIVGDQLVHELLERPCLLRPNEGLVDALTGAFRSAVQDLPTGDALGLITTASELEDLAQMAFTRELLRAPLEQLGFDVVLGDSDNLQSTAGGLRLCGRPISALYRYVPLEAMLGTPVFAAVYDAVTAGRMRLLNGLYGLLLQHKGVLAWLWEHRDDPTFSAAEQAALKMHLPPTWSIQCCPTGTDRSSLVAKQVFGREGEEVFFGEDLSDEAWGALSRRRTYVAQRRISVAEMAAAIPTSTGARAQCGYATVGSYAVNGSWAGYYTRFGGKIVTSRSKWMATFVDGG